VQEPEPEILAAWRRAKIRPVPQPCIEYTMNSVYKVFLESVAMPVVQNVQIEDIFFRSKPCCMVMTKKILDMVFCTDNRKI
jgi:hypothetical protein